MDLKGKIALVTGASRGVGAATAVALAKEGCHVACAARSTSASPQKIPGTLNDTVERIRAEKVEGLLVPTNLAKEEEVRAMVATTVDHFGGIDRVASIGFVDLLQAYESSPDSLNLTGKIAIIDVTAPGIPSLEATPFSAALPVSLIHATVAENVIKKNYLRDISKPFSILLIFLSVFGVWFLCRSKILTVNLSSAAGGLVLLWVLAQVLFSYANLVVPLFYPTFAIVSTAAVSLMIQSRQWQKEEVSVRSLLQDGLWKHVPHLTTE